MNVPALRFPEFEGELQNTKLGDLMAITSASRVHKEEWTEEGVPFFRSSDVVSAYKGTENKKAFISKDLFEKLSKKSGRLVKDDLLVTGGGSIGVPYLVTSNDPLYSKDADLIWLKNGKQTSGQFIYAFLISRVFRKYLKSISHIGTISHYTIEQAKATPIRLPSLPEQKKIAAFLGVVDAKIAALRARRAGLERYKRGLMQALFSQTLRFSKPNGTAFPDWEEKRLGEVCSFIKDGTHGTHKDDPAGEFWLLSAKNIQQGGVRVDASDRRISTAEFNQISKNYTLQAGDILLSIVGTIGRVALFDGREDVAFQRSVAFFRAAPDQTQFLFHYMTGVLFQRELDRRKVVSAQPGIYLGDLAKIEVPIPHPDEQAKIADALSAMDAKIAAVGDQITKIGAFKKGLLQQMFV